MRSLPGPPRRPSFSVPPRPAMCDPPRGRPSLLRRGRPPGAACRIPPVAGCSHSTAAGCLLCSPVAGRVRSPRRGCPRTVAAGRHCFAAAALTPRPVACNLRQDPPGGGPPLSRRGRPCAIPPGRPFSLRCGRPHTFSPRDLLLPPLLRCGEAGKKAPRTASATGGAALTGAHGGRERARRRPTTLGRGP